MGGIVLIIAGILSVMLLVKQKSAYKATELTPIPTTETVSDLDAMIYYAANKYRVDPALVKAVAMVESSLNPYAKNPTDPSWGLMAVMPILAEDFGIVRDWHNPSDAEIAMIRDPQTNLNIGAWHLNRLLEKYTFDESVQMYNVGETGYRNGRRNLDYLSKVKRWYDVYKTR